MLCRLFGVPVVLLAGCSIIYNPDNLHTTDAPEIVDAPADADPNVFDITSVEPTEIDEGAGSANGRAPLFVLHGFSLIADTANVSVEILADKTGDGGVPSAMPMLVDYDIAANSTQGGLAIIIPVLPELDEGDDATMRITVVQGGITKMQDVTIVGHDELTLMTPNQASFTNGRLYSEITVPQGSNLHFAGANVIRLHATAGIAINGVVDGDGQGINPGPHGCAGGAAEAPGGCGTSGGGPGINAAVLGVGSGGAGGGGGFSEVGTLGAGQGGGAGGMASGDVMLVPIDTGAGARGNRGNGGGGGGGALLNTGGAGGGGGGVIYIRSGGDLTIGPMGAVRARGGNGVNGTSANTGGGGGGSGGALLIRSGGQVMSSTRWLSAPAGGGGGGNNAGGAGAAGRIRVDTGGGNVAMMANDPPAIQGPAWSSTVAPTSTTAAFTALLRGQPQTGFEVLLNDVSIGTQTTGISGTVNVNSTLLPGKNTLCALATGSALEESVTCVDVFYIGN